MKYLLLTALAVTACGTEESDDWRRLSQEQPPPSFKVEEPTQTLKQILDNFLHDCGTTYEADVSDVSKLEFIRYGDPATEENPTRVGVCLSYHYSSGKLYKSNITVKQMGTPVRMKALLYHELGHCVLGLDHTDQESKTIMSPFMHNDSFYEENWDKLVKDMCLKYPK
jgi:hypothetical protein